MNDEAKAKMRKVIVDGFGLYNIHSEAMDDVLKGLHDVFIEEKCGNCEFRCNESHCPKRLTEGSRS